MPTTPSTASWAGESMVGNHAVPPAPVLTRLHEAFAQACAGHPDGLSQTHYCIAGQPVRMRIAGRTLAGHIEQPFAHLCTPAPQPTSRYLRIDLWDERATGVRSPCAADHHNLGSTWTVGAGVFAASHDGRVVAYQLGDSVTWLDRRAEHMVGWTASGAQLSLFERGKPLNLLVSVWCSDRNVQVIHAGLVSENGRGVLFPGMGGAGKSTCALACTAAGFQYLGDDYIGLAVQADGSFVGHSLYNSTWLEAEHAAARFPLLLPHLIAGRQGVDRKSLVLLSRVFPERLGRLAPIRALALPRIVATADCRLRPASRGTALLNLAPSSMLGLVPRPSARSLERLAQLVARAPAYWLELGQDLSQIPARVYEMLMHGGRDGAGVD